MIIIKSEQEIEIIHQGGKLLAKILKQVLDEIKPGVSTDQLEKLACVMMAKVGGQPAFKGYKTGPGAEPYPTALCISFNDEVVHAPALPARVVKAGDLVSIDIGMKYPAIAGHQGYFTDMAATVTVGKVSKETKRLLAVTKKSLELAIKKVKPGVSLFEIGKTVEDYVEKHGFSVVRDLVGHGVGVAVHEEPQIPNYAVEENKRVLLKPGMVIAIEPMVNIGKHGIFVARDGMTIKTADRSLSAHFEHTIAVTKNGHKVLTK